MQILIHSKQNVLLSNENKNNKEELEKLFNLANFDSSIIRKIHFFKGKCILLFKRKEEKTEDFSQKATEKLLHEEESSKPVLLKMIRKKNSKINKKIKKKPKAIKPKKKKKIVSAKKAETQTSESLSESSFNQVTMKTQRNNVLF